MKDKILKEIDSFLAILYTSSKVNIVECGCVERIFTGIVNQVWDFDTNDETNLEAVKSSFNFNKAFHNNSDIVKYFDMFMSDYLSKF